MIRNLYWTKKACVKVDGKEIEWQNIRRGVRQGCVLLPDLFSLYRETIMKNIRECEGISIGGRNGNNIRYGDNTVLAAAYKEELQLMQNIVKVESESKGLTINIQKTKWLVMSKNELPCEGRLVERVENLNYLGSVVTEDIRCDAEIKRRIGVAKAASCNIKHLLTNKVFYKNSKKLNKNSCVVSTVI